jgi:hypothetical protein
MSLPIRELYDPNSQVQLSLSKLGLKMWPVLERKLQSDEADEVIRLLTAYAEAEEAAKEASKRNLAEEYHAACEEWRKHAILFGCFLQVKS